MAIVGADMKKVISKTMTDVLRDRLNAMPSIRAVARECGMNRASLHRFALGIRSLRLDLADKLAEYFKLELRDKK
jgi:hypothetical protein